MEATMGAWTVQDAMDRFSEMLDTCMNGGPQIVSRGCAEVAVLMPIQEWRRLQRAVRPTLKELLLADAPRWDIPVPPRGNLTSRRRPISID
jgi:prevent-host-death family protein